MDEEKIENLIQNLRLTASINVRPGTVLNDLLTQSADMLEELRDLYKQDVILGSYVSKTGIMRHLARGAVKYPDFRVDMNSLNAWVCGYPKISMEEAKKLLMETGGRDFRIATPLVDLRVYAKYPADEPKDYPGVYIDAVNWDGSKSTLLCCVEYDPVAHGIYCRAYTDGEAPSESVRFENLDEEDNENA